MALAWAVVWTVATALGCSEELFLPGEVVLTSGHEPDVWSVEPVPSLARIDRILKDGSRHELAKPKTPVTRFSLGRGAPAIYDLSAEDESSTVRVRARSLPVDPAGFAATTLPLFVARTEGFSRPPGRLVQAHGPRPPAVVVGGRFLYVAGAVDGSNVLPDAYDLGAWDALPGPATFECPASECRVRSLAVVDDTLLLAIGDDWARWFDLWSGRVIEAKRPEGLSGWDEVAGGRTVVSPDGTAYVLGGTRSQMASDAVIVVGSGTLEVRRLFARRMGAAALWMKGRGLAVIGGSATGAGAELLAEGAVAFSPLPHAPDPTVGAAVVVLDGARVLRMAGRDTIGNYSPSAEIDLGCGIDCVPVVRSEVLELSDAHAVSLETTAVLAGTTATGELVAMRVSADGTASELPQREARRDATLLLAPTGHAALLGGTAPDGSSVGTLELFLP